MIETRQRRSSNRLRFVLLQSLLWLALSLPAVLGAADVDLTILQTCDIHARVSEGRGSADWLKLGAVINQERRAVNDPDSVLLIDCGDTVQGSLAGQVSKGLVAVEMLNRMSYDVWVLGNHDFDYGTNVLAGLVRRFKGDVLAANVSITGGRQTCSVKPWVMLKRKGLRIVVIGLTYPFLQSFLWGKALDDVSIDSVDWCLKRVMPDVMKAKPDLIILATHQGEFPIDKKSNDNLINIVEKYPQIDLILGGHTHQQIPGHKIGNRTWFLQGGCHGDVVGRVKVTYDPGKHRIKSLSSSLLPVKANANSPKPSAVVERWLKEAERVGRTQVGETKRPIRPTVPGRVNSGVSKLIALSLCEAANVGIAFHGSVRPVKSLTGKITERDLFELIPYEDSIGVLSLDESQIKAIIKEQVERLKLKQGRCQALTGLVAKVDGNGRVSGNLRFPDGSALKPGKKYLVAFNGYVLCGAGNRFPYLRSLARDSANHPKDIGVLVRDAVRKYVRAHSPLRIEGTYDMTLSSNSRTQRK